MTFTTKECVELGNYLNESDIMTVLPVGGSAYTAIVHENELTNFRIGELLKKWSCQTTKRKTEQ